MSPATIRIMRGSLSGFGAAVKMGWWQLCAGPAICLVDLARRRASARYLRWHRRQVRKWRAVSDSSGQIIEVKWLANDAKDGFPLEPAQVDIRHGRQNDDY